MLLLLLFWFSVLLRRCYFDICFDFIYWMLYLYCFLFWLCFTIYLHFTVSFIYFSKSSFKRICKWNENIYDKYRASKIYLDGIGKLSDISNNMTSQLVYGAQMSWSNNLVAIFSIVFVGLLGYKSITCFIIFLSLQLNCWSFQHIFLYVLIRHKLFYFYFISKLCYICLEE